MSEIRLQVLLARSGLGSRRACERLIEDGSVTVNGQRAALGTKVDPARDAVKVRGRRVGASQIPRHLMMNKPRGIVCSRSDPEGRTTVFDLIQDVRERLHTVGRLDIQSSGLLLLTNDGPLTHALTHPSSSVPRVYRVKAHGEPDQKTLARLARGIVLDGRRIRPLEIRIVSTTSGSVWLDVTAHEGRKHLVRDALQAVGHPVSKLQRMAFGPLRLGSVAPGSTRPLTPAELRALRAAAGLSARDARKRRASTRSHRKRSRCP